MIALYVERLVTANLKTSTRYVVAWLESEGYMDNPAHYWQSSLLPKSFTDTHGQTVTIDWAHYDRKWCIDFVATWYVYDEEGRRQPHGIHIASGCPLLLRLVLLADDRTQIRVNAIPTIPDELQREMVNVVAQATRLWNGEVVTISKETLSDLSSISSLSVSELSRLGESDLLEYKSVLQGDNPDRNIRQRLSYNVLKTIAAFLNSSGGILLIGVDDGGNLCGLESDLAVMHCSLDRFEQQIRKLISGRIGDYVSDLICVRFEEIDQRTLCKVSVRPSSQPVFVQDDSGEKRFYARAGNTSRPYDTEQTYRYIQVHWP